MDDAALILVALVVVALIIGGAFLWNRRGGVPHVEGRAEPAGLIASGLRRMLVGRIDASSWERLEELLIAADMGVEPSARVVGRVRDAGPESLDAAMPLLAATLRSELLDTNRSLELDGEPAVILVVGVNGSGKTTTIAKLAHMLTLEGKTVILGAADTFRAAAGEQLDTWAKRVGVDVVTGQQGGDPASVAHDAISSARAKGANVVIVDTAGRLHGKKNLMAELAKIHRVASSEASVGEVLLVLDATSGQNGLAQVEQFAEAVPLTGIALAKLDGTAKGGIVIAIEDRLGVPVKLVGVGESVDDLEPFDPDRFVRSLLEE